MRPPRLVCFESWRLYGSGIVFRLVGLFELVLDYDFVTGFEVGLYRVGKPG